MNELRLYIPTNWNQLNHKQLLFIANLYQYNTGETDFLTRALLYLTGLRMVMGKNPGNGERYFTHKNAKKQVIINSEQLAIMSEKCRFLLTINELKPLKYIRLAKARHYRLYNATLEEYLMAENYYFAYIQTREPKHLANLISVLYRRPWQRWNAEKIQQRAKKFMHLPQAKQNSVFMWYVGFRSFVPHRCPTLFKSTPAGTSTFNARVYINNIMHTLNKGDITRNNTLLKQPVWYALDELEARAKENEQREKQLKKK